MAVTYSETLVTSPAGAQGAYPQTLVKGHEGMLGDLQAYVSRSYRNETGAVIPFGHALLYNGSGTEDASAKLLAGASATGIVGIALDSNTFEVNADSKTSDGRVGYPAKETVNVLSKGVLYVYSAHVIAVGDAVRIYHTDSASASSTGGYKGRFGKTAEAGKTFEATAGARWLSSCAAGGIALLEIDIPGLTVSADT
tara:strand:+ start:8447 stop:9037 length:591 start_codon:yes stop_codon:yes gene_type:complete